MELSGAVRSPLDAVRRKGWASLLTAGDPLERAFLAAALVLALTRLVGLSRWSLWLDEAFTLADARHGYPLSNPIGYVLFRELYGLVPGRPDELWLRLPAAVLGLLSIPATAWALRPSFGARASSLAAFFVAASPWHLYWSQNARFYTLAQVLLLAGAGLLLRGLARGSPRRTGWGILCLFLAPLAHPSAALVSLPLIFLPWVPRWLEWIPIQRDKSWRYLSTATYAAVLFGSGWALRRLSIWDARQGEGDLAHFLKTSGYWFTPTVGVTFLLGARNAWRDREAFVPLYATLVALVVAALLALFVRVSAQYVFVVLPWVAAVAGLAFRYAGEGDETSWARRRRALLALAVALPGLVESGLYFVVRHGDRPRWREAYAYVYDHREPDDLVLGMEAPVAEFYLDPHADDLRDWKHVVWLDNHDLRARLPSDWARYGRRLWLVVNEEQLEDWDADKRADMRRILDEECRLVARFDVPLTPRDLDVLVYTTR